MPCLLDYDISGCCVCVFLKMAFWFLSKHLLLRFWVRKGQLSRYAQSISIYAPIAICFRNEIHVLCCIQKLWLEESWILLIIFKFLLSNFFFPRSLKKRNQLGRVLFVVPVDRFVLNIILYCCFKILWTNLICISIFSSAICGPTRTAPSMGRTRMLR